MKIGVLGGTFDPIHKGHLKIAEASLKQFNLDVVWFMPAGNPYFKSDNITDADIRYEMTKHCIENYSDKFVISDFELKKPGKTYSAETFEELKSLYPYDDFYFILGEDSLLALHTWYRPELLLKNVTLLCARRDSREKSLLIYKAIEDLNKLFKASSPDIRIIDTDYIDISSTIIRTMIRNQEDCSMYLTDDVISIINDNKLYSK